MMQPVHQQRDEDAALGEAFRRVLALDSTWALESVGRRMESGPRTWAAVAYRRTHYGTWLASQKQVGFGATPTASLTALAEQLERRNAE